MSKYDEDQVMKEANKRFAAAENWEAYFRAKYDFDQKFESGDDRNNYQWPAELLDPRAEDRKPTLTINKVQVHVKQVVNAGLKNKPAIAFKAVSDGASFTGAEVFQGIARQIEAESCATDAYDTAFKSAVKGGIGYWKITTDYADPESFDQSIFIKRIPNALSVYLDPNIKEFNGSDARYGFIFDDIASDLFAETYPKYKDLCSNMNPLGCSDPMQNTNKQDIVRTAEYYRIVEEDDTLHRIETTDENGNPVAHSIKESEISHLSKSDKKKLLELSTKKRRIKTKRLEWFLIVGQHIVDYTELPGPYIPIVRCVGEERVIDGTMDRSGLVRSLIDSQRMYNVMNSGAAEAVALQTKVPWIAPVAALSGHQPAWDNQNIENPQYLLYNHQDKDGNQIPVPTRNQPPQYPQAYQQGIAQAGNDMMAASGQYEASFGQESNERSGKAINARTQNGDNSTYHFQNNLGVAITYTGMIIKEWIPQVYDTPGRILKVLGQDGKPMSVQIDPNAAQAHQEVPNVDPESMTPDQAAVIFNPNIGKYAVVADVGDNFATQNDALFNALSQIVQQRPELLQDFGDLLFQSMNIPLADKISERFRKIGNPAVMGTGPTPQEVQMQQQLQQLQVMLATQHDEIQKLRSKALATETQKGIDMYKAETDRLKMVNDTDPELAKTLIRHMGHALVGGDVTPLIQETLLQNAQLIANIDAQQPNNQPQPNQTQGQ